MSLEVPRKNCRCPWCGREYTEEELADMDPAVEFTCRCGQWAGTREDLIGEWDDVAYDY